MFATGCVKEGYEGPEPDQPSRTVLVYLGGDNASLSEVLVSEVESLRKGWSYTGNRCLIYIDPVDDVPRLLSLRGGCKYNPVPYIDTVATYSEENSASASVFGRVMNDVVTLHPADTYGLIFTSHSSGWLPPKTLAYSEYSIGNDQNTGTTEGNAEMELTDFAAAIPDGQFDFIIFESCLMAGVEVAYELRNKTNYILASSAELVLPGFVPIYPLSLRYLFDTKQTTESALKAFATDYYNYVNTKSGAFRSTTLSLIATKYMNDLSIRAGEVLRLNTMHTNINYLQHFDRPGSYGDFPVSPRYFDFMDSMETISTPEQYSAIEEIMNKIVVWKAATPIFMEGYNGFSITKHSGLTIYIQQDCFPKLNSAYPKTAWYQATH